MGFFTIYFVTLSISTINIDTFHYDIDYNQGFELYE